MSKISDKADKFLSNYSYLFWGLLFIATQCTANQRCDFLLMVNSNATALLTVCEIFSCVEVENLHFRPLYSDCRPPSGGTPSNINVIYAPLKSTFSWLQICEITRNSEKIGTYSSSRSSKVIDLGANRKRIWNFLLVITSNFGRISYRFRDIDA